MISLQVLQGKCSTAEVCNIERVQYFRSNSLEIVKAAPGYMELAPHASVGPGGWQPLCLEHLQFPHFLSNSPSAIWKSVTLKFIREFEEENFFSTFLFQ
jgi:hypothetical protein